MKLLNIVISSGLNNFDHLIREIYFPNFTSYNECRIEIILLDLTQTYSEINFLHASYETYQNRTILS